jgi:hypothetical protein
MIVGQPVPCLRATDCSTDGQTWGDVVLLRSVRVLVHVKSRCCAKWRDAMVDTIEGLSESRHN